LDFFGHPDARLLDGGLQAWQAAGLETMAITTPVERLDWQGQRHQDRLATRFDVNAAIDDQDTVLVDTRRESEVRGTEKRARRVGTIPGALHIEWSRHLDENGAFRPADEVRALYESLGVTPDKTVIPYCHTGYPGRRRKHHPWFIQFRRNPSDFQNQLEADGAGKIGE
jgi:thiosulfate/3-mercaptopyruvate sulfurtransferase